MTWADLSKEEDVHFQHSAHAHVDSKVNHAMNTFMNNSALSVTAYKLLDKNNGPQYIIGSISLNR